MKGRIVYCVGGTGSQDLTIKELGGAGAIIGVEDPIDASYTTVIPGAYVEADTVGKNIDRYINSTKKYVVSFSLFPFSMPTMSITTFSMEFRNARAVIHKTTTAEVPAPYLASFSSRGPQVITPNILKVLMTLVSAFCSSFPFGLPSNVYLMHVCEA